MWMQDVRYRGTYLMYSRCQYLVVVLELTFIFFFFQAEDGIRDLVRSRGLGDVYKRQISSFAGEDDRYHVAHRGRAIEIGLAQAVEAGTGQLSLIHI